jgi:hypothetical protein
MADLAQPDDFERGQAVRRERRVRAAAEAVPTPAAEPADWGGLGPAEVTEMAADLTDAGRQEFLQYAQEQNAPSWVAPLIIAAQQQGREAAGPVIEPTVASMADLAAPSESFPRRTVEARPDYRMSANQDRAKPRPSKQIVAIALAEARRSPHRSANPDRYDPKAYRQSR